MNKQMKQLPEPLMKELSKKLDKAFEILHRYEQISETTIKTYQDDLIQFVKDRAEHGWSVPSQITQAIKFANLLLKKN